MFSRYLCLFIVSVSSVVCYAQELKPSFESEFNHGLYLFEKGSFDSSIFHLSKAFNFSIEKKDTASAIKAGHKLAGAYKKLGNYEQVEKQLRLLDQLINSNTPSGLKGQILYELGLVLDRFGKYEESNFYLAKGRALTHPKTDALIHAKLTLNLGNGLISSAKYDEAIQYSKEALSLFSTLQDSFFVSKSNLITYIIYLYMGDLTAGRPFLFEHYRIAKELENSTLLAESYLYLSDYYHREENLSQAILYGELGLNLAEELGNTQFIIRYYMELGTLYQQIDNERALNYYNRAYSYYVSVNNQSLATNIAIYIAECLINLGKNQEAEKILMRALEYYSETNYPYDEVYTLIILSKIKANANEYLDALEYLTQALELTKSNNIIRLQYSVLERMLRLPDSIFSAQEKLSASRELFTYSRNLAPRFRLRALRYYSQTLANIKSDSAFYYADAVLNLIEKKRLVISGGTLKANVFSGYATYYNDVASWYLTFNNDSKKAFELIESSKSRALLDQLAEAKSKNLLTLSEEIELELLSLQKQIDKLYRQRSASNFVMDKFDLISNKITDLELEYSVTLEKVRSENEAWSSFIYPKTLSLDEARSFCDNNSGILEYALLNDGLLIMLITKNEVLYKTFLGNTSFTDDLVKNINRFRDAIISQESRVSLTEYSSPLYSALIKPFQEELKGISNLIIVPDGPIALLPFDALIHNNEYLVESFTLKTLPSLSVFNQIQNPHRTTTSDILSVAGSGLEIGNSNTESKTRSNIATLPFTIIEVDSISSRFSHHKMLKDNAASETSIKNASLSQYKYLHFATHADMNESVPNQSGLYLSTGNDMELLFGEDGFLTSSEIRALNLSADMVVLSACNTANGKIQNGEGLLGLQRAFLVAGASSVVASLWSIYDRSTPEFMIRFYDNLIEQKAEQFSLFDKFLVWADWYEPNLIDYKAQALRQTKLEMLNHPYFNHPVHWASFVITGK